MWEHLRLGSRLWEIHAWFKMRRAVFREERAALQAAITAVPKLGMNFFGLHTYPEGGVGPEPLTWIGTPDDVAADGSVKFSDRARHPLTLSASDRAGSRRLVDPWR